MESCLCYVTCGSREEAVAIAREVVERRLAACANIIDGLTSIYRWEGSVHEDPEVLLLLKTRRDLAEALTEAIVALHSYDCPCVTVLPITGGNRDYLAWIASETDG